MAIIFMKTKNLAIIIILLMALGVGLVIFLTGEKEQPVLNQTSEIINLSNQIVADEKPIVQPIETISSETDGAKIEKIQASMLINGAEYQITVKSDSSVYDLMSQLKKQNKIDFKGSDYSGMGFFIEEINGVKNNPAGENWIYYINGRPAPIGISYYKLKNNDTIEWKYEKKSF